MDTYTQVLSPTGSSILDRPWTIIYKKTHSATSPGLVFFFFFLSVSSFIVFFVLFVFFNFFSFLFSFPRLFFSSLLLLLLLLLSPLIYNLFIRFLFFLYLPDPFSPHLQGSATFFLSDKPLSIFIIPGDSWENTTCLHSIYC